MLENTRKLIINELAREITLLEAAPFELLGHNVVSMENNCKLVHKGINLDYVPVKSTVDSFSSDSTIVAEYSTVNSYFTDDNFKKIINDINHAQSHLPPNGPDRIYLLCNQIEPPSFRKKFNASPIMQQYSNKITIYDARELAEIIFEQTITHEQAASAYKNLLPGFAKNLDNHEYYGKIPPHCDAFVPIDSISDLIHLHFQSDKAVCVLYGVSGSGKTQAAIDYVHQHKSHYENYLWLSEGDWRTGTPLSSVQRKRGGEAINLVGKFKSHKTLLVIDSLDSIVDDSTFKELTEGFTKGSCVLVTSQLSRIDSSTYLQMPDLPEDVAYKILGEDPSSPTPESRDVINNCRFSPLILATAREIIKEGVPKLDIYREIISNPNDMADRDGERIMSRILKRLNGRYFDGLKKIANSGSTRHDSDFLRSFIGAFVMSNLQRLSLLQRDSAHSILKVHDLIAKAIADNVNSSEISNAVETYIANQNGEMTHSVLREIHLCYDKLVEENSKRWSMKPDWITYALLQKECDFKKSLASSIHTLPLTSDISLSAVMCIIDARETHAYSIQNEDEKKAYFLKCASDYSDALNLINNEDVQMELLHHRGKILRRTRNYSDALICFDQVLTKRPHWHATLGQIVHMGTQRGADEYIKLRGEQALRQIIAMVDEEDNRIPLRVALSMLARMRSYQNVKNDISPNPNLVRKLGKLISLSSFENFDQIYEGFVSFISMFGYVHNEYCIELTEQNLALLSQSPDNVDYTQWGSASEALIDMSIAARNMGKQELSDYLSEAGMKFAEAIDSRGNVNLYDARIVAKAFCLTGHPEKALQFIDNLEPNKLTHWILFRKAEALLLTNNPHALAVAQDALEKASNDEKARNYLNSYHQLLSECHKAYGSETGVLPA